MKITLDPVQNNLVSHNVTLEEIDETKQKLSNFEKPFKEKLNDYLNFLNEEESQGRYLEIHWPFFELGLTIMLSNLKGKMLISVFNLTNSKFYGNLIVDEFPCVTTEELKNLGKWSSFKQEGLKIFKPFE